MNKTYETKIPGTRYVCALANIKGQWMIQIKLDDVVEAERVVKDLSERAIRDNIQGALAEVNMYLNNFMLDQITKEITAQAKLLFQEVAATAAKTTQSEMSEIEQQLEQIFNKLDLLEERVTRLERLLEHRE
ncbi:MAG: hypothetical protein ACTSYD_10855 [Candidatus Heimdallarchaeaceae archaeon]